MNKIFAFLFIVLISRCQQDFDDMPLPPDPKVINKFKMDHGIILTICWCFIADLGVFFKFARRIPWNIFWHILCFLLVIVGTIVEVIYSIRMFDPFYDYKTFPKISKGHLVLAFVICGVVAVEIVAGFVSYFLQLLTKVNPRVLKFFRWVHMIGGYLILVMAKGETVYGWVLYNSMTAVTIVSAEIVLVITLFFVYVRKVNRITEENKSYQLLRRPINQEESILINLLNSDLPYNSLALKNFNFFIFNDFVYLYGSRGFHPGGGKIMDLVRGREVDRYVYGMYGVEEYPKLGRFFHPENSFDMLEKPLMMLPKNPIVQLGSDKFIIHRKSWISPTVALFEFVPARGEEIIYREGGDLKHLGQYFKVTGYGFTRLYTCVIALTEESKSKNLEMLARLGITPLVYKAKNPEKTIDLNLTGNQYTTARNEMLQPQTYLNLNHTHQTYNNKSYFVDNKSSLPLLIKKYPGKTFTNELFTYSNQILHISGLKGRGMGIEKLNKGRVLLMAAGTGLYPFIDLLDVLFKLIVGDHTKIPVNPSHRVILQGLRFTLFGSFNQVSDMAIPTELAIMSAFQNPMFNMMVKISKPLGPEENGLMGPYLANFRFNEDFVLKHVLSIPEYDLSMVYVCGPPVMYSAILGALRKHKFPEDKIFLL